MATIKSIEEKAKRYDEIVRVADKYRDTHIMFSQIEDEMFPKLKESEDERIRKFLIGYFDKLVDENSEWGLTQETRNKILAWLEKQKVLSTEENMQGKEDVLWCIKQAKKYAKDENEMGTCWSAEKWLEKQGENSPVLSNSSNIGKDEQKYSELPNGEEYGIDGLYHAMHILEKTLGEVEGYQSDDGILEHKCAISAVKNLYEQKPAGWNKEDEENLKWFEKFFRAESVIAEGKDIPQDRYLWFKNLKGRVQPKQEWSEEDKETIDYLIDYLESELDSSYTKEDKDEFTKEIKLLKSLRPQSHWKPSNEQMEYLAKAIATLGDEGNCKTASILNDLRVELKKLRGEQL